MTNSRNGGQRWCRAFMLTAALLLDVASLGGHAANAAQPNLYVFLQTDAKVTVFEKTLRSKLPALNVTVFGRFRDFDEALVSKPPDAILALMPVLVAKHAEPTLRGISHGQDVEDYVLVSAGSALEGSLSNHLIGAVDILGRADSQAFVAQLLKTPDVRTKLVTKLEDLLSLLQFSASEAILVPAGTVKVLTERSRLSLHVRPLPESRVGLPSVAILSPAVRAMVIQQIQALDRETNQMMGVESWRAK